MSDLTFDATRVVAAATRLDAMADALAGQWDGNRDTVAVQSGAADEVSQRAARTMTDVATDFGVAATGGVAEIRALAATLRAHATTMTRTEDTSADFFRGLV